MGGLIGGMVGGIFGMWAGAPDMLYHGLAFGLALGLTLGLVSGFRAGAAPSLLFTEVALLARGRRVRFMPLLETALARQVLRQAGVNINADPLLVSPVAATSPCDVALSCAGQSPITRQ
jgi:hypothetical protein